MPTDAETGICTFDYSTFQFLFPELASVPRGAAQAYFARAGLILSNKPTSPVPDVDTRSMLLYLLVAHVAALNAALNGQAASPLVGRISNASEGSVSVSVDMPDLPGSAAYYSQTKYGLEFYNATASLRTMRYIPGRQPVFDRPGILGMGLPRRRF